MKTKRIISIILALIISCQSLSLNVFANNAEIEDILSYVNSTAQTPDDYTGNTSDYEEIGEELPPSYDELPENGGIQIAPDIIDDSSLVLDPALSDTVSERTSALLDIDYASAQRMIAAYGSEETALSEAENYAELERIFYALDYPDIKDKLIELLVSGYGSQRVAYSGIVAIVLDADIEEVILKNSDVIPDDIYTEYLAQQLFVSPSFVASYTLETGLSTEVMYHLVLSALQEMYPSVFGATTLSDTTTNERPSFYQYSPYYVDMSKDERISPVSGALAYTMNLASIPGVNGMDIDIALRYDSDRSVAQGEYKVTYGGQTNPDGSVVAYSIHEYDPFSWDDRSIFMFGTGWRLNYDYIYRRDGSLLLILSDGRQYEITGSSPNYTLSGLNSGSLTLTGINENDAKYKLTYYDGTVEKFNSKGELLSKTDRYGNCITFIHESITNPEPYTDKLVISNSHSTVTIYSNLTGQKIVLPDGNTILLSYIHRNNDYLLTSITNQAGEVTAFNYQSNLCGQSDSSSVSYNPPGAFYATFQKLYYNYLTEINHPTGAKTVYTYGNSSSVVSRITSRKYTSNGEIYNNISYNFGSSISTVDYGSKKISYEFDYRGLVTKETVREGDKVKSWVERTYNVTLGLPTKVVTAFATPPYGEIIRYQDWSDGQGHGGTYPIYDTTSYFTKQDTYQYNSVGLITNQVVDGVTTVNTYNDDYYILTRSTLSGEDGNTKEIVNFLTSDNKAVLAKYVANSNVLYEQIVYMRDSHGNPVAVYAYTNNNNHIDTQNTYSDSGRLISTTTAGVTTSYTYDSMGRVLSETDGLNRTTYYQYDVLGRLVSETYPDNSSKTYSYTVSSTANKTVITDELGFKTTYNYNALGDIISVYSGTLCLESTTYDAYRRVATKTDGNGATTVYTYDYADRVTKAIIENTDYEEQYSYSVILDASQFKAVKTVVGGTVPSIKTVSYTDAYGRLIADGAIVGNSEWLNTYTYDSFGNKIQELTANDKYNSRSFTNKYTYDVKGNVTSVCNALNQYTYKTYDWLGNVLTETDLAGNVTEYTYDAFGRVLTKTVPVDEDRSQLVTNTYDANGNLTSENISEKADSSTLLIKSTEYTYNNRNNLTSVKTYGLISSSHLSATTYTYDAKGQVLSSTTGGYTTSYTYDGRGNVLSTTYPGGGIETFTYNAANNVITSTDRKGVTTTYTYNLFGKPTSITAGGKTKSYTYASNGSVLTETSEAGTISYTYDELGRKVSETTGGKTTNYTYDRAGNILTVSQQYITTYEYDALNRVVKAYTVHSSANYTYNEAGQRASMSVRSHINEISRTTYTYNYAGAITSLINSTPDGEMLSQFTYTYDVLGNILTAYDSTTSQTANYAYDALGRLISEIKGGNSRYYTYDAAGNRTKAIVDTANTIVYTYDSDGRLISETLNNGQTSTATSYTYDANGNLASKTANNVTTTYTFDVWGNMTSAAGATYTYNVQNLRISKTIGNKTINFTLIGDKIYIYENDYPCLWGIELVSNGSVYYLYNAHGDVIQLLNSNGEVTKTYNYDAYGNELTRDQNDPNPFRYCGEYYDTETGFIYLRARYYSPSTGRFISQDTHWNVKNMIYGDEPVKIKDVQVPNLDAIKQSSNLYVYCTDNPLIFSDPSGEFGIFTATLIRLGVGAIVGAAFGAVGSIVSQAISGEEINWKKVGIEAVSGAVSGLVTSTSLGKAGQMIINGAIGFVTYTTECVSNGEKFSIVDATLSTITGVAAGAVSGKGVNSGKLFSTNYKVATKQLAKEANRQNSKYALKRISYIKDGVKSLTTRLIDEIVVSCTKATAVQVASAAIQAPLGNVKNIVKEFMDNKIVRNTKKTANICLIS